MYALEQRVLRADISGLPLEWIDYREAARLYCQGVVAYSCGSLLFRVHGGTNAASGCRSFLDVSSIIATQGDTRTLAGKLLAYVPPLNNPALFMRDGHLCMYCGGRFAAHDLSRDHVTPMSRGGQDMWPNVVAACKRCNHHKGAFTLAESGMELLAVPFTPSYAEYLFLQGRRILADQMEFLRAHFPRSSPMHDRLGWFS